MSLLWLLALRLGLGAGLAADPSLRRYAAVALAVVVLQISLGGWVTSNYAALACPDLPTCHGQSFRVTVPETAEEIRVAESRFPTALVEVGKAWAEMVHRYFATGLGALIVGLTWFAYRNRRQVPFGLPVALLFMVKAPKPVLDDLKRLLKVSQIG